MVTVRTTNTTIDGADADGARLEHVQDDSEKMIWQTFGEQVVYFGCDGCGGSATQTNSPSLTMGCGEIIAGIVVSLLVLS
jgi:hypothetical protein